MGCHVAPDWHAGDVAPGGRASSEEVPPPEWGRRNHPAIRPGVSFSGKGKRKAASGPHRQGAAGRQAVPGYPDVVERQGDWGTKAGDGTAA